MTVTKFFALLTLIADIAFVLALVTLFIPSVRAWMQSFFRQWYTQIGFLLAFASTAGSLILSEVAGFVPCDLCWYQRILMYPLVILFGLALLKNNAAVRLQAMVFSVIGVCIAIYHILLQQGVTEVIPCSNRAVAVPCGDVLFREYGYITIPVMSLTMFAWIILGGVLSKSTQQSA